MSAFTWSDTSAQKKTFAGRGDRNREKLADVVEVVQFPGPKDYGEYRFIGGPAGTALHWLNTKAKPKPGEKKGKVNSFPKACLGFNAVEAVVDAPEKCPYCTLLENNPRVELRQNVIDRKIQEAGEPRKAKPPTKFERKKRDMLGGSYRFKESKDSPSWTPVRVLTVNPSIGKQLGEITSLNRHVIKGKKQEIGPDHVRYGYDVMVKHNPKADSPNDIYKTQKGEIQRLTEEELEYLLWQLPEHKCETEAEAKKEAKRVMPWLVNREGEYLFPDAQGDGKKDRKNRHKDKFDEDDDEDMEEDDDSDDDDDDDDRRGKSKKSKSKKSNWDEDEDDEDEDDDNDSDDDDDDDEEDDRRSKSKKNKSKSSSKSKSKRSRDDDDDDEEDEDDGKPPFDTDDDDEEEERPRKSKSSKPKSSGKVKTKSKSRRSAKPSLRFKSSIRM